MERGKNGSEALASELWASATEEEKGVIRFGMIPVSLLRRFNLNPYATDKALSVALMDEAERDGGMIA